MQPFVGRAPLVTLAVHDLAGLPHAELLLDVLWPVDCPVL
jgi:hypothetical protein